MVEVVPGMPAVRGQLHPTEFAVRIIRAALPRLLRKVGKGSEGLDLASFHFSEPIAPHAWRRHWRTFGCRQRFGLPDEIVRSAYFFRGWVPLKRGVIKAANAFFRRGAFTRSLRQHPSAIHQERVVHEIKRLLRDGGERALSRWQIGIRKVEYAIHAWQKLAIHKPVDRPLRHKLGVIQAHWFSTRFAR